MDLEPRGSAVADHVDYATGLSGGHSVVASNNTVPAKAVLGDFCSQARARRLASALPLARPCVLALCGRNRRDKYG